MLIKFWNQNCKIRPEPQATFGRKATYKHLIRAFFQGFKLPCCPKRDQITYDLSTNGIKCREIPHFLTKHKMISMKKREKQQLESIL